MSESEEENFCFFGKPLDPYDEDAFPKKKPISVEDQIATDAQGRRRFHGAFTGGFSAGFFNTVGSLEGWTPSEFKSTRQDKAKGIVQRAQDYMDEEDMGEYGIAHQTVKATSDFSTAKKRRRQAFSDGPIPGIPVLETLLTSGNETVGYLLLKNIGIQEKIDRQFEEINSPETKTYGCHMPKQYKIPKTIENKQYQIPAIYKEFLETPKSNTFGLGYQGLDRGQLNLFHSTGLVMKDKNNKKVSISGQAFGVGAFEEEDDDIYTKEDMSRYDFELTKEKRKPVKQAVSGDILFGTFRHISIPLICKKIYAPPTIPRSFTGKHKVKKSRFEPVIEETHSVDRREINPDIRARYLGEESNKTYTQSQPILQPKSEKIEEKDAGSPPRNTFDISSILMSDRFVSASVKEDVTNILEPVTKLESTHGTKDMRDAARMKMFGPLTRITVDWQPCAVLCKRFNVPEPSMDQPQERRKRTKNLIFEYQKHREDDAILKPGLSTQDNENITEILPSEQNEGSATPVQTTEDLEKYPATEIKQETNQDEIPDTFEETLPKDMTEKVDVAEKKDLFKAIFLSSSESEEEEEKEEEDEKLKKEEAVRTEELKSNVLSDQFLPKIKSNKEGILSNMSFHTFTRPKKDLKETESSLSSPKESVSSEKEDTLSYGPQLPSQNPEVKSTSKVVVLSSESDDGWVEVDKKCKKKKKSKHKKNKKEKHKKIKREKKSRD